VRHDDRAPRHARPRVADDLDGEQPADDADDRAAERIARIVHSEVDALERDEPGDAAKWQRPPAPVEDVRRDRGERAGDVARGERVRRRRRDAIGAEVGEGRERPWAADRRLQDEVDEDGLDEDREEHARRDPATAPAVPQREEREREPDPVEDRQQPRRDEEDVEGQRAERRDLAEERLVERHVRRWRHTKRATSTRIAATMT
jgi:hypothetical protein